MSELVATAAELLERWREAERRRDTLMPGTLAHDAAAAECDDLTEEYRRLQGSQEQDARELASLEPV